MCISSYQLQNCSLSKILQVLTKYKLFIQIQFNMVEFLLGQCGTKTINNKSCAVDILPCH